MELADLLQLRDSGSSVIDSGNAAERNRQFNKILVALQALGSAFGTSFIGGAATEAYTPTVTAGSNTFTSVAGTGRFLTVGKFTWVSIVVTITTNGTAATSVIATLPATAAQAAVIAGSRTSGNLLQGRIAASGTSVALTNYDNTYPGADGAVLTASGWYETV